MRLVTLILAQLRSGWIAPQRQLSPKSAKSTFAMATIVIAHLGPIGTYAEAAALAYADSIAATTDLLSCNTIAQAIAAVADGLANLAVVPVENSIEGSVTMTLDSLWQTGQLQIQQALVLSIEHTLITTATNLHQINTVYSHPQALSQCQGWLAKNLPTAQQVAANSTTAVLTDLARQPQAAAIASQRAADLYHLPTLAQKIGDYPDNRTRFWVLGQQPASQGSHTSLAFSLPANMPGALLGVLAKFAQHKINLSRIESRPTKKSLGDYLFFVDIEADGSDPVVAEVISDLTTYVENIKSFGSYYIVGIS
jgi:prephenate dehydratase